MTGTEKHLLNRVIDLVLFGDIDEVPLSVIGDRLDLDKLGDDTEAQVRAAIAATLQSWINEEIRQAPDPADCPQTPRPGFPDDPVIAEPQSIQGPNYNPPRYTPNAPKWVR